jgi:hypothetical protein
MKEGHSRKRYTRRCIKLVLTRESGLGLGASGVGFGLLRKREGPGGKSLSEPGRRAEIGL